MLRAGMKSCEQIPSEKTFAMSTYINPYLAKVIYLNFQPLEVVSRYRDPQAQVVKKLLIFFLVRTNYLQILIYKQ